MDHRPSGSDAGLSAVGIGYLWIPHLPLAVALRQHLEAAGQPAIVGGRPTSDGVVVDASDECLAAGVRLGQPLREAWECCREAAFLPADPDADRRAQAAVLDLVETMAPIVEDDGLGRAAFALGRLVGREDGRWFLATLRGLLRARLGFRARLALAPGPFVARVAAERDAEALAGTPIILADEVAAYLAPHPLEVLPLPDGARARLRLLGVATVGEFARLPCDGLARRFGPEAVAAHRLALGQDDRPLVVRPRAEERTARHVFEPAIATVEPLLAVGERLLDRLCRAVGAEGKAFRSLRVAVEHEDGSTAERTTALRRPTAAPADCRAMLRALVQALGGGGEVAAITVTVGALRPAGGEQLALLAGPATETRRRQRLAAAAREVERRYPARLRRVVPSDVPTLLDEQQFALLPYEPEDGRPDPPTRPTTARPVRVARRGERRYLVESGRWDELIALHGCWRAEEWWPAELARVYWRVRTRSGRVCTLSRDAAGWRLVEVFD